MLHSKWKTALPLGQSHGPLQVFPRSTSYSHSSIRPSFSDSTIDIWEQIIFVVVICPRQGKMFSNIPGLHHEMLNASTTSKNVSWGSSWRFPDWNTGITSYSYNWFFFYNTHFSYASLMGSWWMQKIIVKYNKIIQQYKILAGLLHRKDSKPEVASLFAK